MFMENNISSEEFNKAVKEIMVNNRITNVQFDYNEVLITFEDSSKIKFTAEGSVGTSLMCRVKGYIEYAMEI